MKQKWIIAIVALLLIAGGVYWYIQSNNKATAPSTNETGQTENQEEEYVGDVPGDPIDNSQTPTSDTIAVSTQIAGDSVTIDNVYLSKAGFITIHEITTKGMPGNIIGTSGLLTVGPKQDLEIRATIKPGAKYIAMVRADNGDRKFNAEQDEAITLNSAPVMTMFSVSQ